MLPEAVSHARATLETLTPLRTDCGLTCGGACCRSLEGETTGMLLFPGEEADYADLPGYRVLPTEQGALLVCDGHCRREERPLSCRLFPLLPLIRQTEAGEVIRVGTDQRAKTVCPLARQGKDALSAEFVSAVREVGRILAGDEAQRAFLLRLTHQQDELKALRSQFGRDRHV